MNTTEILQKLSRGELTVEAAQQMLKTEPFDDLGYAKVDYHREIRTGVPEVIYCAGKTGEQICGIVKNMMEHGAGRILGTRCDREKYEAVRQICPDMEYDETARIITRNIEQEPENNGMILVACAGTSDLPVAREAALTARFLGNEVEELYDVGVAGIHRLLSKMDVLSKANVVIAVAGMEGALASVIGGLTDKPVIAVPTSVGYGASFGGVAALLAMLNSCASGISVVNIDNGFGAGYMAHSINCLAGKRSLPPR
ncbi:MAG: nickel pincer cofactor biosynthesis protein LarB [Eubacteriales bacterium]|nr:nickel pincer cofactor biosynthesis protein LarB [Eubacteriales bacterium]